MNKKIFLSFLILFALVGCQCTPVKVPVWTPPKITKPVKPILVSDGIGTQGEVARKLSLDLTNMSEYSMELENIINAIESQSGVPPIDVKPINNK
jgi:hypothetical protein